VADLQRRLLTGHLLSRFPWAAPRQHCLLLVLLLQLLLLLLLLLL
jgi:hypothetical protein